MTRSHRQLMPDGATPTDAYAVLEALLAERHGRAAFLRQRPALPPRSTRALTAINGVTPRRPPSAAPSREVFGDLGAEVEPSSHAVS